MASKLFLAAVALANMAAAIPTPHTEMVYGTENMSAEEVYNITKTIDLRMLAAFGCVGQSCIAADYAGSSGKVPRAKPLGGAEGDMACVKSYNPDLKNYGNLPDGPAQSTGISTTLMSGINSLWRPMVTMTGGATVKGAFSGTCAKNILIFAKGTFEPGAFGMLVGPTFTSGLPAGWSTANVPYDADIPGDFCLGLPGGMVAKDVIQQAVAKCPTSNLYLSGYSQGAMVVRNGLAYAEDSAKSHVKGIVTFGDPFNGSPVKGWNGPIKVYCNTGDGVCSGNFELAGSHLSYGMDSSATLAKAALLAMAAGGGGGSGGLGGLGGLLGGRFGKL